MTSKYQTNIQLCIDKTNALSTSEIKYYLLLLINSIKAKKSELTKQFVNELLVFINSLDKITALNSDNQKPSSDEDFPALLKSIQNSYDKMVTISKTAQLHRKVGYGLLNVGGAVLGLFTGVFGGLVGGFSGFIRGTINGTNPFVAAGVGGITGGALGAAIGFRTPKKVFKNELTRQLKFCMDGMRASMDSIQVTSKDIYDNIQSNIEDYILKNNFAGNTKEFQNFLDNKSVPFEVCSLPAQFISETLEGYLGHHSFIKISINNKEPIALEFSTGKTDLTRKLSNTEQRYTSGQKIIEMMTFHTLLQQTHACTPKYIVKKMKSGDVDCLSYVNKILTGTSQKATKIGRFDGSENWVGRNVVGFFIRNLSPFDQNILINDDKNNEEVTRAKPK